MGEIFLPQMGGVAKGNQPGVGNHPPGGLSKEITEFPVVSGRRLVNVPFSRMRLRLPANLYHGSAIALGVLATVAGAWAAATAPATSMTVRNFEYSGFGDNHYKSWDVQGAEAQTSSDNDAPVVIAKMKLHMFSATGTPGNYTLALETTIESDHATVLTGQGRAQDPGQLNIFGSNNTYSVTGYDWLWESKSQTITVNREVRVIFRSEATASKNSTDNTAEPITILSDSLKIVQNVQDADKKEVNQFHFEGNVSIIQGQSNTTCRVLDVVADRAGTPTGSVAPPAATNAKTTPSALHVGTIESIVAQDHVVTRQGDLDASGDVAQLFSGDQRVELTGSPQARAISSDILLQGGRIIWFREKQEVHVEPLTGSASVPGRVRVSMPPLATYEAGADTSAPAASTDGRRLIITGEALQFSANDRRFDIEKSVQVNDPSLTVEANHLDAEFDPAPAAAPASPNQLPSSVVPQMGRLNHLTMNGGVAIHQDYRQTTTEQAEILPGPGQILLSGHPHVVDSNSHAIIDGHAIQLTTDGQKALVQGAPGEPAKLYLPSLQGINDGAGKPIPTTITCDAVSMQRADAAALPEDRFSTFIFTGQVHVSANDLEATCEQLNAYTRDATTPAGNQPDPLAATGQLGEIIRLELSKHVEIEESQMQPGQTEVTQYKAHAARATIDPRVGQANDATGSAPLVLRRSVELFGDANGVDGPVRPMVEVPPIPNMGLTTPATKPTQTTENTVPAKITSDEQWLLSGKTGVTYWFKGNVLIDGGTFNGTCDQMRAEGNSAVEADNPNGKMIMNRIVADGHVIIKQHSPQGDRVSTAGQAEMLPRQGKIELTDNVLVTNPDGSQVQNANIEIVNGKAVAASAPAAQGQPVKRPTIIMSGATMNFDKLRKPADKSSTEPAPAK